MSDLLIDDIATTVAQLKDEVLFIEDEMNKYHKDMNSKMKRIYNKVNGNEDDIFEDKIWVNEYLKFNNLSNK